jgi:hypothetical protein
MPAALNSFVYFLIFLIPLRIIRKAFTALAVEDRTVTTDVLELNGGGTLPTR